MNKIDSEFADVIISHLIDISNDKLIISESEILEEPNDAIQEILMGLKHLSEDLLTSKEISAQSTEKIKIQNKQLSKQNEELEHFAYIISHDLKAPLLAIHSIASFIEEDISNGKTDEVLSNLDLLKTRVERMEKLITGILNFSKIGMTKTAKESIDLNILAKETFDSIDTQNNYQFNIINSLPTIVGVKALFIQLFSNITSNAIKYNDKEQGSLDITFQRLGNSFKLSFKDNGPGIPLKYQQKIFSILQTLDNTTSIKNTGIGLSIVQKIATSLGGSVNVESEVGKSTTFIVELPVHLIKH